MLCCGCHEVQINNHAAKASVVGEETHGTEVFQQLRRISHCTRIFGKLILGPD